MSQPKVKIGIIGGSGLYKIEGITIIKEVELTTPFGAPSDKYIITEIDGAEVIFLPRHGRNHDHSPSEVNYRANIFGMKQLGVNWIIAVSAVGSLKEELAPGHVVLVDQFIDRTVGRKATFFTDGIVAHVPFAYPVCSVLQSILLQSCNDEKAIVHPSGTYVNMEGPAFSTVAESHLYRSWGASVIGMTTLTEAKLAREAEISYAVLAMVTDYDCWKDDHNAVTVDQVVAVMKNNSKLAQAVVRRCIPKIVAFKGDIPQSGALRTAVMTDPRVLTPKMLRDLAPLIGKYYPAPPPPPEWNPAVKALAVVVVAGLVIRLLRK